MFFDPLIDLLFCFLSSDYGCGSSETRSYERDNVVGSDVECLPYRGCHFSAFPVGIRGRRTGFICVTVSSGCLSPSVHLKTLFMWTDSSYNAAVMFKNPQTEKHLTLNIMYQTRTFHKSANAATAATVNINFCYNLC